VYTLGVHDLILQQEALETTRTVLMIRRILAQAVLTVGGVDAADVGNDYLTRIHRHRRAEKPQNDYQQEVKSIHFAAVRSTLFVSNDAAGVWSRELCSVFDLPIFVHDHLSLTILNIDTLKSCYVHFVGVQFSQHASLIPRHQ